MNSRFWRETTSVLYLAQSNPTTTTLTLGCETTTTSSEPYKAIVFLMLTGACDSYNVLVPHSQCDDDKVRPPSRRAQGRDLAAHAITERHIIMSLPAPSLTARARTTPQFLLSPSLTASARTTSQTVSPRPVAHNERANDTT